MLHKDDRAARRTARYVDGLLAAGFGAKDVAADPLTDAETREAARRLRSELVRVHPSFRFEEELAAKLVAAAANQAAAPAALTGATAALTGAPSALATPAPATPATPATPSTLQARPAPIIRIPIAAPDLLHVPRSFRPSRPLIVGGVVGGVAASALSLGAFVAWRATRQSPPSPAATTAISAAAAAISAAAAAAASAGGTLPVATDAPLHRGRGSAVLHGILGVVS